MNYKEKIVISTDIVASLRGMDEVVSKIKKGLSDGAIKTDLSKGLGLSLSKSLDKFYKEYSNLERLMEDGINIDNSGKVIKSGQQIIDIFREIEQSFGKIKEKSVIDTKKIFPDSFQIKSDSFLSNIEKLEKQLSKMGEKVSQYNNIRKEISELGQEISLLKEKSKTIITINTDEISQKVEEAKKELEELRQLSKEKIVLRIESEKSKSKKDSELIDSITKKMSKRGAYKNISIENGKIKYKGATLSQWEKGTGSAKENIGMQKTAIKILKEYISEYNKLLEAQKRIEERQKIINKLTEGFGSFDNISTKKLPEFLGKMGFSVSEIEKVVSAIEKENNLLEEQKQIQSRVNEEQKEFSANNSEIEKKTKSLEKLKESLSATRDEIFSLKKDSNFSELEKLFKIMNKPFNIIDLEDPEKLEDILKSLQTYISQINKQDFDNLIRSFSDLGVNTEESTQNIKKLNKGLDEIGENSNSIKRMNEEIENLNNQVLDFFSLSNATQLLKNTISSSIETIKELDATMTEAATVTDFSISDMWNQLPEYSEEASKLGAKINDLYGATTLYYQQGLNTNQAMAVGVETMKMARIAAMDSTEATQLMTAALRGFNMELNEISAQRVNDVYSELAAITAADTAQIGIAMSKTASIAASANMEFETTAAILSQIIETTQEAPETAGTALKTIIARFTEVKELYSMGELFGTDSEGQEISINKIDTALQSVGISLKDFLTGSKGLDDILLELASKWDSLDIVTQRYIATTAAGSRQQSRFLAMMSDYDRTMELVNAANNSAGASQEQFNKTLDSLDSKLNELKNAWDEFAMGIANNQLIKIGVDTLKILLDLINKLTNSLGDGISGFLKLGIAIAGLKIGKTVFSALLTQLGNSLKGKSFADTWLNSLKGVEKGLSKQAKEYANIMATIYQKELKSKKLDSFLLQQMFDDSEASKELAKNMRTLVPGIINSVNQSIDYENLNSEGKKIADTLLQGFSNEIKESGKVSESLKDLQTKLSETDWEKYGAKKVSLDANGVFSVDPKTIQKFTSNLVVLGGVAAGVGMILGGLADVLKENDFDDAATGVRALGTAFATFGTIVSAVGGIVQVAGWGAQVAWGPVIGIIAGISAVIGVFTAISSAQAEMAKNIEEANKEIIEQGKAIKEQRQEEEDLFKEYQNLLIAYKQTGENKEGLVEATQKLAEAYDLELNSLDLLSKSYDEVNKKILETRKNALETDFKIAKTGLMTAEDVFFDTGAENIDLMRYPDGEGKQLEFTPNVRGAFESASEEEQKLIERFREDVKMNEEISHLLTMPDDISLVKEKDYFNLMGIDDAETLAKVYEQLQKTLIDIESDEDFKDIIENSDFYQKISQWLKDNQENYQNYIELKQDVEEYSTELADVYTNLSGVENLPKVEEIDSIEKFRVYKDKFIQQLTEKFEKEGIEPSEEIENLANEYLSQIGSLNDFVQQENIFDEITTEWKIKFEKGQSEKDLQKLISDLQEKNQLNILADLSLPEGLTFDQLQEYVDIIKKQVDSAFSKETIEVSGLAISSLLENGDLSNLDEEQTQNFNEKMQLTSGVYNKNISAQEEWENISASSGIFEQIQYLADLQQREAALAQQVTAEAREQLKLQITEKEAAIQTAQAKVQEYESTVPEDILKNIDEYKNLQQQITTDSVLLDELKKQLDSTDWHLQITTSGTENILSIGDGLVAQSEQIKNAAMLIGEGFKVAAEDAQQLANIFPELMENAEVLSDGTIKLSAKTVAAVLGDGQEIVNGDIDKTVKLIDNQIQVLTEEKAAAEAKFAILKANKEGEVNLSAEEKDELAKQEKKLLQYLIDLGLDEEQADNAIQAAKAGNMQEYNRIVGLVSDDVYTNLSDSTQKAAKDTYNNSNNMVLSLDSIGRQAFNVASAIASMVTGTPTYSGLVNVNGGLNKEGFKSKTNNEIYDGDSNPYEDGEDTIDAEDPLFDEWISKTQLEIKEYTQGIAELTALKSWLLASKENSNLATDAASSGAGGASPFEDKKDSSKDSKKDSSKEEEKWENTYDWLYNLTQDINEQLRIREKLERNYDRLLQDTSKSAADLHKNLQEQLNTLEKQKDMYQEMYDNRKKELEGVLKAGKNYSEYATYNWKDNTIEINWDKLNKVTDKSQGEAIEHYISQLEEIESQMEDAEESLDNIKDEIKELQDIGKEEYESLEDKVINGIIAREQEKIDKLSLIDESINDANNKLITSIQNNLDKIRQDRQNEQTEQSIEDNERRLAYLQQDTSGANDLEIQRLQEELSTQKQDYTDTLIDQKLTAIQEQNDKASEERQYQIELAQAQLEEAQKNGDFWNEAYRLIKEGTDATGKLVTNSQLTNLLKTSEGWQGMSKIKQMDWLKELENEVKAAMIYFSSQRQLEKIGKKSGKITFTNANGEKLTGTVQKDGSVKVTTSKGTYIYRDVFQNFDGTYQTLETNPNFKANPSKPSGSSSKGSSSSGSSGSGKIKVGGLINAGKAQIYDYAGDKSGERQYFLNDPIYKVLGEKNGYLLTRWHKLNTGYTGWFKKSDVKAYAKGGLADFTGPAWLDGTKSKPELVLNARDTENFIQLKDILSNLLRGDTSSGNSGDNYFEIHIDVDSLNNDYDVEQLATKIKKMINDDARYRNVNSINLLR